MNGTYGLIAEQGFYCVLAAAALVLIAVVISVFTYKDEDLNDDDCRRD